MQVRNLWTETGPGPRTRPPVKTTPGPVTGTLALVIALLQSTATMAGESAFSSGNDQVTLLELYTSQGCSSCPPAERWLNEYVDDEDLWTTTVPLAFHVDYWDYIGWKDIYASHANGERQRAHARAGKSRTVYTPGFFSNGREWRGWTVRLKPRASDREPGNLSVTVNGNRLEAAFAAGTGTLELHVALLGFGIETQVKRGENRNSTLQQEFVVLAHAAHASTDGSWSIALPRSELTAKRYGIAAWVSEPENPAPIQATGGWLPVRQ